MSQVVTTSSMFPGGGSFKVDGVHSDYFGMYYKNWSYDVIPAVRSGLVDIPGRRGKADQGSELSSRLLSLDVSIYDIAASTRWGYMSRWAAALNPETGPHAIELCDEHPGWQVWATAAGGSASPNLVTAAWTQSFEIADPHWYATAAVVQTASFVGSPVTHAFVNTGNTFAEPVLTISPLAGQTLSNPTITYGSGSVSLGGILQPGESWTVNTATKTVLRNGVTDMAHWSGSFPVLPGSQAGYDVGGLSTPVTVVDLAGHGAVVVCTYTPRLL